MDTGYAILVGRVRGIRFTTGLHQFNSILIHIQIKTVRCEPVVSWLVWHTERQSPLPDYTRSIQP